MTTTEATTLRDVAKLVGVSIATVSAALNGSGRVSNETRDRVLKAAEALNYVPNVAARGLHRSRTGVVGVLLNILAPAQLEIATGLDFASKSQGRQLLISTNDWVSGNVNSVVRTLAGGLSDGIILIMPTSDPIDLNRLRKLHIPVILANNTRPGVHLPRVCGDNRHSSRELTMHLIGLGHTRFAFIRGDRRSGQSDDRERGFRDALGAAGISLDEGLVYDGDFQPGSGYRATTGILLRGDAGPTAIFAASDTMAQGVLDCLATAGKAVPDDYSVVGFDDSVLTRTSMRLTTVHHPFHEVGIATMNLMDRLIDASREEREVLMETSIELPSVVVVGESSGAPRSLL
jgi:LacI family transcriptional regulator